jgi:uncharacterized iron-regulated protein
MDLNALGLAAALAISPVADVPGAPVPHPAPGSAPTVIARRSGAPIGYGEYLDAIEAASIVAVGEQHDDAAHHAVQREVLVEMALRGRDMVIALEMLSADDQPTVDAFLSGSMSDADFAAYFERQWGFPYALYSGLFDTARAVGIPVVGVNVSRPLIRRVSSLGLAGLTAADRALLPASIQPSGDARYQAYLEAALNTHGPMPADRRARMLEVQSVWNEAMGENVARLASTGRLVVVIAGQGHVFFGAGIPESAVRRGARNAVVVLPTEGAPPLEQADYFRLLP